MNTPLVPCPEKRVPALNRTSFPAADFLALPPATAPILLESGDMCPTQESPKKP